VLLWLQPDLLSHRLLSPLSQEDCNNRIIFCQMTWVVGSYLWGNQWRHTWRRLCLKSVPLQSCCFLLFLPKECLQSSDDSWVWGEYWRRQHLLLLKSFNLYLKTPSSF
jgi:hypothetical protein